MKRFYFCIVILFLFLSLDIYSQNAVKNKYGLVVVDNYNEYKKLSDADSLQLLVDLEKFIPSIKLEIHYAASDNFFKEPVYNLAKAFLRLPAAIALREVQAELKKKGLGIKIFDGYRPYSVTVRFFDKLHDTVFLAVPWRGSRHNRGCAVDLSLISLKTGKELKMPTHFDDFTEKAHSEYKNHPKDVIKNREVLRDVMTKHGFKVYPDEWWHFDFNEWQKFELTDIPFEELIK